MRFLVMCAVLFCTPGVFAEAEHAVSLRGTPVYLAPDNTSEKLAEVTRGRDLAVLDKSGNFLHVLATIEAGNPDAPPRQVTGWVENKDIITQSTPNGDAIIFGEAVDSEHQAEQRNGRRGAAQDAMRLYAWIAEWMEKAPLAGEAMYRAGDIRWQLEKSEAMTRKSWKEKDPYMRHQMEEDYLKKVQKKFPGTRWAALAAWDLLDNKLCGDWQNDPKCPEKESSLYEKYATEYPESPKVGEALYNAAYRQAALVDMFTAKHDQKKADEARARALALAQKIPAGVDHDWSAEGARLVYMVQNNIPVYTVTSEEASQSTLP